MENPISLPFNSKKPEILHIDLNSCFARIEQQANPKLRGKPIAVAAYTTPSGCIIAPSVEAKTLGIRVGMRVEEGKKIYPGLIVLPPDPWKYRDVHLKMKKVLQAYTDRVIPKSIDEFVLILDDSTSFKKGIVETAIEIKKRIRKEVGDFLLVSVGIAANRFLAKTGAGLHKPDGLDIISKENFWSVYRQLKLTDLCGIKVQNMIRLNNLGIYNVCDFYNASYSCLKAAFESIAGYYWYLRLRGWEIDDIEYGRKSFGNSFAIGKSLTDPEDLGPILSKLSEKTGKRMRRDGFWGKGVHLSLLYRDFDFWHKGVTFNEFIYDSRDIYKRAFQLLVSAPKRKPVREIAVSCFHLKKAENMQMSFLIDEEKKKNLVSAIDDINEKWGNFVITPGRMLGTENLVVDRVAFGGIKELEDMIIN